MCEAVWLLGNGISNPSPERKQFTEMEVGTCNTLVPK